MKKTFAWTTPDDITQRLHKRWLRGDGLRALTQPHHLEWPLSLPINGPDSGELTEHFDAVRQWVTIWQKYDQATVQWRTVHHRVQGEQQLPWRVVVASLNDFAAWLGKHQECAQFQQLWQLTQTRCPALLPWLERFPLKTLQYSEQWNALLNVVQWVAAHPQPAMYLRQVTLPGVHSKLIEQHRAVLAEWLDIVLTPAHIDEQFQGVQHFALRYGFRDKPERIRFRLLDRNLLTLPGFCGADITLTAEQFAALQLPIKTVFITENEINFLTFPEHTNAIVVFGAGYGWRALSQAQWLHQCEIYYWVDIDTHGFAILSQLRAYFCATQSLLMDEQTLLTQREFWGEESTPTAHDLPHLTAAEQQLYDRLRKDYWRAQVRLEQERIPFTELQKVLLSLSLAK